MKASKAAPARFRPDESGSRREAPGPRRPEGCRLVPAIPLTSLGGRYPQRTRQATTTATVTRTRVLPGPGSATPPREAWRGPFATLTAVAETSSELGGALGIAVLASIAPAACRHELSVNGQVGETIGEALGRGGDLGAARDAFVQGMHVAAGVSALLVAVATAAVLALLRRDRSLSPSTDRPVAVAGAA